MGCTQAKGKHAAILAGERNAVNLRLREFMTGPLGNHQLFNETQLLNQKLEFKGKISKIAIIKLFKKMHFKVAIKIEEAHEEQPSLENGQKKRTVYKEVQSNLNHQTQATSEAKQNHIFPDIIHFDHNISRQEMRNQFLSFYLQESGSTLPNGQATVSVYRINLALVAVGPAHHAIELQRASIGCLSNGSQYSARLSLDVKFVQTQRVEIQLSNLQAKRDEKILKDAYQAGFSVVTFKGVNDSNKSYHSIPQAQETKQVEFRADGKKKTKEEEEKQKMESILMWEFAKVPLKEGSTNTDPNGPDLIHHLDAAKGIFENSFDSSQNSGQNALAQAENHQNPPYTVFTIHMDHLTEASIRLKIWQDKNYKDNKRVKHMSDKVGQLLLKKGLSMHNLIDPLKLISQKSDDQLRLNKRKTAHDEDTNKLQLFGNQKQSQQVTQGPLENLVGALTTQNLEGMEEKKSYQSTPGKQKPSKLIPKKKDMPNEDDDVKSIEDEDDQLHRKVPISVDDIDVNLKSPLKKKKSKLSINVGKELKISQNRGSPRSSLASERNFEVENLVDLVSLDMKVDRLSQPALLKSHTEQHYGANYKIMKGAQAAGDALDIYGFGMTSPDVRKTRKLSNDGDDEHKSNESANSQNNLKIKVDDDELIGECYIGFEKLLSKIFQFQARKNLNMIDANQDKGDDRLKRAEFAEPSPLRRSKTLALQQEVLKFQQTAQFEDKLWYCGRQIGTVSGTFRFINFPFITQMSIGVLSNQGVQFSSKPILNSNAKEFSKSQIGSNVNFRKIIEEKTRLIKNDKHQITLHFSDQIQAAEKLNQALQFSEKQSMTSFIYHQKADLMQAQAVFIEIGEHMLEFCDFVNQFLKEPYYKILVKVLERGELDLGQMLFEKDEQVNTKLYANKKALTAAYQKFIFRMLEFGLKLMLKKGVEPFRRSFVCKAITIGYFRVPAFRKIFLESIVDGDYRQVIDHDNPADKLVMDDLMGKSIINKESDFNQMHKFFDWQKYCYDFIEPTDLENNQKIIKDLLTSNSSKWSQRIRHRGQVFFMVIQAWVRHIRQVLYIEKAITWQDIPGYREILKALFEEMHSREIVFYPDALVESVKSFLANPRILNVAIHITFLKTYAHNPVAVMKTMDMTQRWFLKLNQKRMLIPADFDWTFFMTGIQMLLKLDHSTSTAKVIWLLYQIIHTIPKTERDKLIGSILQPKVFHSLFFHWSWNVRQSFYYFFYFQLHRLFIDSRGAANDLNQSIQASLADLGLESGLDKKSNKKAQKLQIPLHEDIPKDQHIQKEAPVAFAEMKFFEQHQSMNNSVHGAGESNRLEGESNQNLYQTFKHRLDEVQTLRVLCSAIKQFIKRNKDKLLSREVKEQPIIQEMKKSLKDYRNQETSNGGIFLSESTSKSAIPVPNQDFSVISQSEQSLLDQSKEMHKKLAMIFQQASFNLENFANSTEDQIFSINQDQVQTTSPPSKKPKFILTDSQRNRWNSIIKNIPTSNRVYIRESFKQIKVAQRDYQDWGNYLGNIQEMLDNEMKSKSTVSIQGFEGKPDFPTVDIHVADDKREMETSDQDW